MTLLNYASANAGALGVTYFNLARDCSIVDAKNHEQTDRDGHVKGYLINYSVVASSEQILNFTVAPNTWKMRNAFRKFHAYRDVMFENAGIEGQEKGRYGHTLRPYFDNNHRLEEEKTSGVIDVGVLGGYQSGGTSLAMNGGEWTYSVLATVPLYEQSGPQMGASALKVADEWPVMIMGSNEIGGTETDTSGSYASVGMIHSYNLDRMEVVTPTSAATVAGPSNPFAALIASGNQAAGEILDIAINQELEAPPYDLKDNGDSTLSLSASTSKTPTTLGIVRGTCFVPAGLLAVHQSQDAGYLMNVEVLDVVLCKDME
jgi:hypothetical protein